MFLLTDDIEYILVCSLTLYQLLIQMFHSLKEIKSSSYGIVLKCGLEKSSSWDTMKFGKTVNPGVPSQGIPYSGRKFLVANLGQSERKSVIPKIQGKSDIPFRYV